MALRQAILVGCAILSIAQRNARAAELSCDRFIADMVSGDAATVLRDTAIVEAMFQHDARAVGARLAQDVRSVADRQASVGGRCAGDRRRSVRSVVRLLLAGPPGAAIRRPANRTVAENPTLSSG